MTIRDVIKGITDRIHDTATVKNVYGDPIVAEGKTVIPVARVRYGFGYGGGQEGESADTENSGREDGNVDTENGGQAGAARVGGGGGGGVSVNPIGVVEITANATRYISFGESRKMFGALVVGLLLGMWWAKRRREHG